MNKFILIGALLELCLLVACDPGGDDEDRRVESLTVGEAASICNEMRERYKLTAEQECESEAAQGAASIEACEAEKQLCLEASAAVDERSSDDDCSTFAKEQFRRGCSATLAELEACARAQFERRKSFTCDAPGAESEYPASPIECTTLKSRCPLVDD